ncbi:MAG TPA: hypothetical protein PKH65_07730 [Bacteroidia bacterium]|nr:hypothetical protein [Bacteroidia bacterium]HNT80555.1 hypothetical protein [Bacteroidia bacterium]
MKNKKTILAGIVGGVTLFLLGWLFYGILLAGFMADNGPAFDGVYQDPPHMLPLFLGNLFFGFFIACMLGEWDSVTEIGAAAKRMFIAGLLIGLGFDLIMMGTTNLMTPLTLIVDVITFSVMLAVTGMAEVMLLRKG